MNLKYGMVVLNLNIVNSYEIHGMVSALDDWKPRSCNLSLVLRTMHEVIVSAHKFPYVICTYDEVTEVFQSQEVVAYRDLLI